MVALNEARITGVMSPVSLLLNLIWIAIRVLKLPRVFGIDIG